MLGIVVVPTMFVSENHGYVTVCHGEDFVSRGSAAALDEVDRVLTTHYDTKILPRIGPTAFGEEVIEGKHLAEQSDGALKVRMGVKQQTC